MTEPYVRSVAPDGANPGAPGLRVVIVGLGFCGLTCAIECRLRGMDVVVVEPYPTSRTQGDVIDFFANGGMIIESWDDGRIADQLLPICINRNDTFKFYNAKGELLFEDIWLKYPHHARRQFAGHRGELHTVISDYAARLGVVLHLGETVVDYLDAGTEGVDRTVGVVCQSGLRVTGDVVLCCDGPKSLARTKVLHLPDNKVNSGYAIYRAFYTLTDEMRKDIYMSRFCDPDHDFTGMWVGKDLHALVYSWNRGRDLGWVLTHKDEHDIGESWSFPGKKSDVLAYLDDGGFCELLKEVVRRTPDERLVDYKLVWRGPLESWIPSEPNPRVIVLGDAAHCHLPTSGQGASQSVEDGAAIAVCLDKAKGDVPLALRVFERIRFNRQHVVHMSSISIRNEYHHINWTRDFVREHPDALVLRRPDWVLEHDSRANAEQHFDHLAEDVRAGKKGNLSELSVPAGGEILEIRPEEEEEARPVDTAFSPIEPASQTVVVA
ncbi:salicylate hydroxylase [Durotheca rogersii]|uniref:salicylate hydroxylase n=1 Tax=Durotheca rogersii TaxID=419775 RepID=UPI00221F39CF|nr:salicylate hydroxylase [Durotheca rogersii]KAI5867535.1 salicylate hydroxylase [Durotheca rogersii]